MTLAPEFHALVARTLSLYERIELHRRHPECFAEDGADEILERWERQLARADDPGALDRRLQLEGFDRRSIRPVLGRLTLPSSFVEPTWVNVVEAVLDCRAPQLRVDASLPFAEYWAPWVEIARRRVAVWDSFPEAVQVELVRSISRDLAQCGTQSLMHEFDRYRAARRSGNALFFARVGATPQTTLYRAFLDEVSGPSFLAKYARLARLAATRLERWARNVSELAARLARDRPQLEATLGVRGPWVELDADLSDSHPGGRRVMRLGFANGVRAVYKPKDLATERVFQSLLTELNQLGFEPPLRTLAVIECEGYGWVEHVAEVPCADHRAYYERCGGLLALLNLLGGSDCHHENIIGSGAHPVLIDHEVLLSPDSLPEATDAIDALRQRLHLSVLRTGLLPAWTVEPGGAVVDVSGLGARSRPARGRPRLVHVNTDDMAIGHETEDADGVATVPDPEVEANVTRGFRAAYRLLASSKLDLGERLAHLTTRFVARSTVGYAHLLRQSRRPDLMEDGLRQTIELDRLTWALLSSHQDAPPLWPLIRAEHTAIADGDVPYFVLRSASTDVFLRDPESGALRPLAASVFVRSGVEAVRRAAHEMSEDELTLGVRLIECSFSGMDMSSREEQAPNVGEAFDSERAVSAALSMAHQIAATAIHFRGHQHRVSLELDPDCGAHRVALMGAASYGGHSGIALFLGAASVIGRDGSLRQAALDALAGTRAALQREPARLLAELGLGGFEGAGSLIYTFATLGRLMDEPALIDDARRISRSISPAHIEASPHQDVLSGTAGLILALAALGDSSAQLEQCGLALLRAAVPQTVGIGWPLRPGAPALCGMSHGNAGIAAALMVAGHVAERRDLRDAAFEALRYEHSLRDEASNNWPDLRVETRSFIATWCHGAPGIALARSRMLAIEDHAEIREDLALAIEGTKAARLSSSHLCCGMSGIDDILFELGKRTGDTALVELARGRTMSRLVRAEEEGMWRRVRGQSLMRGSAGIGLGLLRMSTRGNELPCVLDLS